jgi:hypothetical protein
MTASHAGNVGHAAFQKRYMRENGANIYAECIQNGL